MSALRALRTLRAGALRQGTQCFRQVSSSQWRGSSLDGFMFPGPRALKNIAKLPLLEKEPSERVASIWREYHEKHKTAVSDVLTPSQFGTIMMRAKRCPNFVVPVVNQKKSGFFTVFTQWQDQHCIMTYLEDYKKFGAAAAPYMIVTLFDDLIKQKDLVLLRGEVFTEKLSKTDANSLLESLKRWYLGAENDYQQLILFNEQPDKFDFKNIVSR